MLTSVTTTRRKDFPISKRLSPVIESQIKGPPYQQMPVGGLKLRETGSRRSTPCLLGTARPKGARSSVSGASAAMGLRRDDISLGTFIRGLSNARYVTYHKLLATVEDLVMAVPSSSSQLLF